MFILSFFDANKIWCRRACVCVCLQVFIRQWFYWFLWLSLWWQCTVVAICVTKKIIKERKNLFLFFIWCQFWKIYPYSCFYSHFFKYTNLNKLLVLLYPAQQQFNYSENFSYIMRKILDYCKDERTNTSVVTTIAEKIKKYGILKIIICFKKKRKNQIKTSILFNVIITYTCA